MMAANSSIPAVTTDVLSKLERHVDGRPVLYGTRFARQDNEQGRTTTSVRLANEIPNEGWLIVTPAGLHLFKKTVLGGPGKELATLTNDVVAGVSVLHARKLTRTQITITLADQSLATIHVRTVETYPALSPWIRGATGNPTADSGLGERLPAVPDASSFVPDELLGLL